MIDLPKIKPLLLASALLCLFSIAHICQAKELPTSTLYSTLTEQEQKYLESIDYVAVCLDPNWESTDTLYKNSTYYGLMEGYLTTILDELNKEYRIVHTASWAESIQTIESGQCSVLPAASPTPSRTEFLRFSEYQIPTPLIIATNKDAPFISDFTKVLEQTFAIVERDASIELLKEKYPQIKIIEVASQRAGLELLKKKDVFGYIDTLPGISYQLTKGRFVDIKISGDINLEYSMGFAVQKDNPLLYSILNKALWATPHQDHHKLYYEWVSIYSTKSVNTHYLWSLLGIALLFCIAVLYRFALVSTYNTKLTSANRELETLYKTDKLTKLFNRHALELEMTKELIRFEQYDTIFSVIVIDIDYFKQVNDSLGHHAGDALLTDFSHLLRNNSRKSDIVGRWGGEEFLIICPETELSGAVHHAEKLRKKIEAENFPAVARKVTASFGVTDCRAGDSSGEIIQRADNALYESKNKTRNCVSSSPR